MSDHTAPPPLGPWRPLPQRPDGATVWEKAPDTTPPQAQPAPTTQPATPATAPKPEPTPEDRRAKAAAEAAAKLREEAAAVQRAAVRWALGVILISAVITAFGSGNAHEVFRRHDTQDPWAWFPYPALEAALIVEIQIGGALAKYKKPVRGWGAALRFVTAAAAVTVCVYGPAEKNDLGGAFLHALGPVVQFFLAEFLARARDRFKAAAEELHAKADRLEGRAPAPSVRPDDTRTGSAKKRTKPRPESVRPRGRDADETDETRTKTNRTPPPADTDTDDSSAFEDLLVRARTAADELERTNQKLNRDNLVRAIRAGGGSIQNKDAGRVLAVVRAERGAPDLHPVERKGA